MNKQPKVSYKNRKRLALFVLLVAMPAYVVVAVSIMSVAPRLPYLLELFTYIALGIGWIFPVKWIFLGIGQPDPDAEDEQV